MGVAIAFAVIGSTVLYKIVDGLSTLRADADDEVTGLDQVEHGERGYTIGLFTGSPTMFGMLESENETAISSTPKNGVI